MRYILLPAPMDQLTSVNESSCAEIVPGEMMLSRNFSETPA